MPGPKTATPDQRRGRIACPIVQQAVQPLAAGQRAQIVVLGQPGRRGGLGDWLDVVPAPIQARGAGVVSIPPRFPVPPALAEPGGGQELQLADAAELPEPARAGHAARLSTSATRAW